MDDGNPSIWKQIVKSIGNKKKNSEEVIEAEIISMVNEGHEQGVILASEAEMIHNIFEFGEKEAKDIMTHRNQMVVLDAQMSYHDAVLFMVDNNRSRYPVFDGDIDHIIGVVHIKDAFAFSQKNEIFRSSLKDIQGLIREVDFVPETTNVHELFKTMQKEKSHMIIVIDEYGQTSGLVAMEDILEEIVGNIEDEHDMETNLIMQDSEEHYVMDGLTPFEEVVDTLSLPVEEDAFDTLNGLLISLLDRIPSEEESLPVVSAYGYEFKIGKVEGKIIREVSVTKKLAVET